MGSLAGMACGHMHSVLGPQYTWVTVSQRRGLNDHFSVVFLESNTADQTG